MYLVFSVSSKKLSRLEVDIPDEQTGEVSFDLRNIFDNGNVAPEVDPLRENYHLSNIQAEQARGAKCVETGLKQWIEVWLETSFLALAQSTWPVRKKLEDRS